MGWLFACGGRGWARRRRLGPVARGFAAMLPVWAGAVPVGIAYGVAARDAGLGAGEAQLMSLVVFSAAAQMSAVSAFAAGAPVGVLIGTAMALNVQLPLLGVATGRGARSTRWERFAAAWFLTEGAYGIAASADRFRLPTLIGAGASMYVAWNAGTAIGVFGGGTLPATWRVGLDLVAPLTFLAVLVPLVRTRPAVLTVFGAAATAWALARVAPVGLAVVGGGMVGGALGCVVRPTGARSGRVVGGEEEAR